MTAPLPDTARNVRPVSTSTPSARCSWANHAPTWGPRTAASGCGAASTIVTTHPRERAVAATSWPMKPAPITATRSARVSASHSARPSSTVRRTETLSRPARARRRRARAARGDQQSVVAQLRSVGQEERVLGHAQAGGAYAEQQLDVVGHVPVGGPQGQGRLVARAGQQLLGQRRTIVGRVRFGAHHADRAGVPLAPQCLSTALRGEATAGEDDALGSGVSCHDAESGARG